MFICDSDNKCRKLRRQNKSRFSLIVEQILGFASSPNMVKGENNLSIFIRISNKTRDDVLRY